MTARKIAIITDREIYTRYGDDDYGSSRLLIESITEWQEVEEADYRLLLSCQQNLNFTVIEPTIGYEKIHREIN